jgi:hypothetical protein
MVPRRRRLSATSALRRQSWQMKKPGSAHLSTLIPTLVWPWPPNSQIFDSLDVLSVGTEIAVIET